MTSEAHCGHLIEAGLRRCGLTMLAVSERTGISPSVLSRIRTGNRSPTPAQASAIADALGLDASERTRLCETAERMRLPATIRERLAHDHDKAQADFERRRDEERQQGTWRTDNDFNDGWWLSYSRSFRNDGLIQRSLVRVEGRTSAVQVMDEGMLRYSYHGSFELLGSAIFIRATEDRGDSEHLQIILHSPFDLPEPVLLYGLVCGISGRDLHHPVAVPATSRIMMLYAGGLDMPAQRLRSLQAMLGGWEEQRLAPCWPDILGPDRIVRAALRLGDGDLDQAVLRLIDNHIEPTDHVLRGSIH